MRVSQKRKLQTPEFFFFFLIKVCISTYANNANPSCLIQHQRLPESTRNSHEVAISLVRGQREFKRWQKARTYDIKQCKCMGLNSEASGMQLDALHALWEGRLIVQLWVSRRSQAWKGCRRRGDGECKVTCQRWAQNESCYKRLHLKGSVNQGLPLPSTCRATKEEQRQENENAHFLLCNQTQPVLELELCKGTESFPPEAFHFPRQGCNYRRKKK